MIGLSSPQVTFAPKLDDFPTMPPADNLFVIEEEESEEMQSIEVISKDMGRKLRFTIRLHDFW